MIGSIESYVASYFNVEVTQTQILFPILAVISTLCFPVGGWAAKKFNPKLVITVGAVFGLTLVLTATF